MLIRVDLRLDQTPCRGELYCRPLNAIARAELLYDGITVLGPLLAELLPYIDRDSLQADQTRVVLLKPLLSSPLIEVGEFSYYDDPEEPTAFATRNVLYHYGPEKLIIGKFCAIGEGVQFIMNGANHRMDGPSTFLFPIMGGPWSQHVDLVVGLPSRGDTVVGSDVCASSCPAPSTTLRGSRQPDRR